MYKEYMSKSGIDKNPEKTHHIVIIYIQLLKSSQVPLLTVDNIIQYYEMELHCGLNHIDKEFRIKAQAEWVTHNAENFRHWLNTLKILAEHFLLMEKVEKIDRYTKFEDFEKVCVEFDNLKSRTVDCLNLN